MLFTNEEKSRDSGFPLTTAGMTEGRTADGRPKSSNMSRQLETALTTHDHRQLVERGISLKTLESQLATFQRGIPFTNLKRACRLNDGIRSLDSLDTPAVIQNFERARTTGRTMKFVPASGVGTRMFKFLETARLRRTSNAPTPTEELNQFFSNLPKFAFYHDLKNVLSSQGQQLDRLLAKNNYHPVIDALLDSLNYARLPKGLMAFHRYTGTTRTPIEEHLVEAADYVKDDAGRARVHFTVSPDHQLVVQQRIEKARHALGPDHVSWVVGCSAQKPSTDTVAVTMGNDLFRDSDDNLLFRPAGHGALLSNLQELHGDVVFIKNIDNVVPDHLKETGSHYKRILGGLLVGLQDTLFSFLTQLESGATSSTLLERITEWANQSLTLTVPNRWHARTVSQKAQWLFTWLNRPIRVCGMVPNVNHPGGGPFWVEQENGTTSLQIVETSQVDPDSPTQRKIFASSTHFNPVDMVCGVRDYQGNPFNLDGFVDPDTGFIAQKSYKGRELKALELPGLWNGGMAKWHSVFVEIPRETFNPVKTVLDLLSSEHQPPERP